MITLSVFILGSITLAYLICSILVVAMVDAFMMRDQEFAKMTLKVFRAMNSPVISERVIIDTTGAFTATRK